jgi:hypothetical protein
MSTYGPVAWSSARLLPSPVCPVYAVHNSVLTFPSPCRIHGSVPEWYALYYSDESHRQSLAAPPIRSCGFLMDVSVQEKHGKQGCRETLWEPVEDTRASETELEWRWND